MSEKQFASPREEALEIALQTRKDILAGKNDSISILRACLLIANDLSKKAAIEWINNELNGYDSDEVPNYRVNKFPVFGGVFGAKQLGFKKYVLKYPARFLEAYSKRAYKNSIRRSRR